MRMLLRLRLDGIRHGYGGLGHGGRGLTGLGRGSHERDDLGHNHLWPDRRDLDGLGHNGHELTTVVWSRRTRGHRLTAACALDLGMMVTNFSIT